MGVKLLTEHNLECLSLTGGCTGSFILFNATLLEITCCGSFAIWALSRENLNSLLAQSDQSLC